MRFFTEIFLFTALVIITCVESDLAKPMDGSTSFPGQADLVRSLPNVSLPHWQNYSSIGHYSSNLDTYATTKTDNRLYWFFKSQSDVWQSDPVVLWQSGYLRMLNGAFTGVSPIRMNENGTLTMNPYAWNKKANLLFVDTFPDIYLSLSPCDSCVQLNDTVPVKVTLAILEKFFEKFPQLSQNEFYIAGEGHVSMHIGLLGKELVEKKYPPNFKGVVMGNGVYNLTEAANAHLQFVYEKKRDVYNQTVWTNFTKSCCPSCLSNGNTFRQCQTLTKENQNRDSKSQSQCNEFYAIFMGSLMHDHWFSGPLDLHNIEENCESIVKNPTCKRYIITRKIYDWARANFGPVWEPGQGTNEVGYSRLYSTLHAHMMFLLRNNIRVLLYTGDQDGIISHYNTKWLLDDLSLTPINSEPSDWKFEGKTAGTRQSFCEGLTYYSVKGAGHTVAEDQPGATFEMIKQFLFDNHSITNASCPTNSTCPRVVQEPCTKFCSIDPSPAKRDRFGFFWVASLWRYYAGYQDYIDSPEAI